MTTYADGQPEPIIDQLMQLLPPEGQVLDIGCGEGRNTLPLARRHFRVEGWDNDEQELLTLRSKAGNEGLRIKTGHCDMRDLRIGYDRWDAILTILCLHFLRPEDAVERLQYIRSGLKPGGYHGLVVFTDNGTLSRQRNDRFFPKLEEMLRSYAKWEIVTQETGMATCLKPGLRGDTLTNEHLTLLARKPLPLPPR